MPFQGRIKPSVIPLTMVNPLTNFNDMKKINCKRTTATPSNPYYIFIRPHFKFKIWAPGRTWQESYLHEGNPRATLKIERWIKRFAVPYNTQCPEQWPEGNLQGNLWVQCYPPPSGQDAGLERALNEIQPHENDNYMYIL